MVSSIVYSRHPERSEGSDGIDFSPTAQNDEFRRYALFSLIRKKMSLVWQLLYSSPSSFLERI